MGSPFPCFANKFLKYPSPSLVSRKSPFPLHCPCAPETNSIQRGVLAPTPKGSREQFDWSLLPVFLKATSYLQEPIPTWGYHLSGRTPDSRLQPLSPARAVKVLVVNTSLTQRLGLGRQLSLESKEKPPLVILR